MKLIVTLILFTISNAYYFFNSLNRIYIKAEDGLDIAISSKYALYIPMFFTQLSNYMEIRL